VAQPVRQRQLDASLAADCDLEYLGFWGANGRQPSEDGDLSRWMQWLLTAYVPDRLGLESTLTPRGRPWKQA